MAGKALSIDQLLVLLAEAPPRIATLTDRVEPVQLRTAPSPGEWSANDVLAHLRACADVWGGYIARILAEDHPKIRAVSPRSWIHRTGYPDLEFRPSLQAYANQRAGLLTRLKLLTPDDWSRAATATGAVQPIERTVFDYATWIAEHERPHLEQIERLVHLLHP